MKIIDATDMTDRQGRRYQALYVVADLSEKVGPLQRDEQLKVLREDGSQAGTVRFCGVGHIQYARVPENPPMIFCVATDTNVRTFVGCALERFPQG